MQSVILDRETEFSQEMGDLLYLSACAVNQTVPDEGRASHMDLGAVYRLASFHSVVPLVSFALEQVTALPQVYDQAKKKAIRKLALFDIERSKILSALVKENIWYLLLKGIVIKDYYPKFGMREMVDNDILCDPDRMQDVKDIMEGLGFHCDLFGVDNQDVYSKDVLCFEIHSSLFQDDKYSQFSEYYQDVKTRLICDKDNPFAYRFNAEDLYIFILAHEYKHYSRGGVGIRSLLDTCVFLQRHNEQLDWNYIDGELQKLSLTEFEKMNRELAEKAFSGTELNEEEKQQLMYYLSSGAHGTADHMMHNRVSNALSGDDESAKGKYIRDRIFLRGAELKRKHPLVYRHKILLPFFDVYRLFRAAFTKPKKTWTELKRVLKFKKEETPQSEPDEKRDTTK